MQCPLMSMQVVHIGPQCNCARMSVTYNKNSVRTTMSEAWFPVLIQG